MKNLLLLIFGILIGGLATYFYCCYESPEEGIIAPSGIITPEEAKTLDQAFNSRHQLISDSIVKRPDNRSSWYSLEDMRNYLDYAENETKGMGYTMDGIRLYLGAYPDVKGQVGYTTMFFIPTGYQATSKGNMTFLNFLAQGGKGDIPGAPGFNEGEAGHPPSANYPQ
jgi:hypothetical protein